MKIKSNDYQELRTQAKGLGINTKGLKKEEIIAKIEEAPNTETRGRKVDPNSVRQQRLAKQKQGHRGRPIDPNSEFHKRKMELEEKRKEGTLKLGRPVDPNSARQERLSKIGTVKRGRPVGSISELNPIIVEEVIDKAAEKLAHKIEEANPDIIQKLVATVK